MHIANAFAHAEASAFCKWRCLQRAEFHIRLLEFAINSKYCYILTMSETENRKLSDLRVFELRAELEKRGLEKFGNKPALVERLQKVCINVTIHIMFSYTWWSNNILIFYVVLFLYVFADYAKLGMSFKVKSSILLLFLLLQDGDMYFQWKRLKA